MSLPPSADREPEPEPANAEPHAGRSLTKPMLKHGVSHAVVANGVYVEAGERNFLISGQRLREAVRRMLIGLDGTRSYAELGAGIPAPLKPVFDTLLARLDSFGMLTEGPTGTIDHLGFHSGLIGYVQDVTPDWERCLTAWTKSRISICADPSISHPLAKALSEARAGSVHVVSHGAAQTLSSVPPTVDDRLLGEILLSVENDGAEQAPQFLNDMAKRHVVAIPCRVMAGNAVIGPDCRDGLNEWRHAIGSLQLAQTGSPATTIAILTAVLAFEAFASHVADFAQDAGKRSARSQRVKIIRHDGTVSEHGLHPLTASAFEKGRSMRHGFRVPIDDDILAPWFDDAFGPFEEIDLAGPAYPLAHEAIGVRGGPEPMAEHVVDTWGISPAQAHERALKLAIATMMERRVGHAVTPGRSPLVAGRSVATIEDDVAALAIASSGEFMSQHEPCRMSVEALANEDGLMLARLARLYAGEFPIIWARRSMSDRVSIVWARLGRWTVAVAGRDIGVSIAEAIGDAVSAFQRDSLPYRQTCWPWSMWRGSASGDVPETLLLMDSDTDRMDTQIGEPARLDFELLDDPAIPPGFFVGYGMAAAK